MPKKTKKEKILTEKRKLTATSDQALFSYTYALSRHQKNLSTPTTHQLAYLRKDLIKTLIISTVFIAVEILLSIYAKK